MYRTQKQVNDNKSTGQDQGDQATLKRWLAAAHENGSEDSYSGKRTTPRIGWKESVTLEVMAKAKNGLKIYGFVRDISAGGMGLRFRQRVAPGSYVRITLDSSGETLCGRVRHCCDVLGAFVVGVEFEMRAQPQATLRLTA